MAENAPSVVIVTGEASGDMHGAHLATSLKQALPSVRIRGVGGRKMRDAGVQLLFDSSAWSAIGIAEGLKVGPRLLTTYRKLKAGLVADPPDLVILIDFGAFNTRLGRFVHSRGMKVLYYFPPSSWNRHANYERLKEVADRVVSPFPWTPALLEDQGIRADFFGHPLLDVVRPSCSRDEFCRRFGFDASRPIVGLLPGSRAQEIIHNLPPLVASAAELLGKIPDLQFAVPPASSVDIFALMYELRRIPWVDVDAENTLADQNHQSKGIAPMSLVSRINALARTDGFKAPKSRVRIKLLPGMAYDVLAHSRAAVVTSGTATVEAAILGCPMVIIYRGSRLTTLEYKLRGGRLRFIGMPNIILDRPACPELVANAVDHSRIAELMLDLVSDSPKRARMLQDLAEVRALLGEPGAVERTTQVVLEMLGHGT